MYSRSNLAPMFAQPAFAPAPVAQPMYMRPAPLSGATCAMRGFGADDTDNKIPWLVPVVVVGVLGLLGVAIYYKFKLTQSIVEKHGVGSALAFEAGTTGLGMLADATRARRNGRRRSRRRG